MAVIIEMIKTTCKECKDELWGWFQSQAEYDGCTCQSCINKTVDRFTEIPNPSNPTTEGNSN